jgi:hypothetical protein
MGERKVMRLSQANLTLANNRAAVDKPIPAALGVMVMAQQNSFTETRTGPLVLSRRPAG